MSADDVSVGLDEAAVAALRAAAEPWAGGARGAVLVALMEGGYFKDAAKIRAVVMPAVYEAVTEALAAVPRPATQPDTTTMLAIGERMEQACAEAYQRGLRDGRAAPSQPAHGEALTEAERERVEEISCRWSGPPDLQCDVDYLLDLVDRLAAQPAHGDNEAALRALSMVRGLLVAYGEQSADEFLVYQLRAAVDEATSDESALRIAGFAVDGAMRQHTFTEDGICDCGHFAELESAQRHHLADAYAAAALSASAEPEGGEGR